MRDFFLYKSVLWISCRVNVIFTVCYCRTLLPTINFYVIFRRLHTCDFLHAFMFCQLCHLTYKLKPIGNLFVVRTNIFYQSVHLSLSSIQSTHATTSQSVACTHASSYTVGRKICMYVAHVAHSQSQRDVHLVRCRGQSDCGLCVGNAAMHEQTINIIRRTLNAIIHRMHMTLRGARNEGCHMRCTIQSCACLCAACLSKIDGTQSTLLSAFCISSIFFCLHFFLLFLKQSNRTLLLKNIVTDWWFSCFYNLLGAKRRLTNSPLCLNAHLFPWRLAELSSPNSQQHSTCMLFTHNTRVKWTVISGYY